MKKYYTRACNFYYGTTSQKLIKRKKALPLCGNRDIAFDKIEILTRKSKKIVSIKKINLLPKKIKNKINNDIKNIIKKKIFII